MIEYLAMKENYYIDKDKLKSEEKEKLVNPIVINKGNANKGSKVNFSISSFNFNKSNVPIDESFNKIAIDPVNLESIGNQNFIQ